jgi:hypothetical protein
MLVKKTSKNQVTLPQKIVAALPETDYFDVILREGNIVFRPVTITEKRVMLSEVRRKIRELGLRSGYIDDAVRWARSRRSPT